ncbi:MAG: hypothetical protein H0U67_02105, partial [Gemmatimonadetes bacterium]|nr:hypothetical protein [Gemmatimonadota bacterium]
MSVPSLPPSGRRFPTPRGLALGMALFAAVWTFVVYASSWNKSAAVDEVPHLAAGLSILAQGDFRMNPEHPPLVKVLATLPVYLFYRPDMQVDFGDQGLGSWLDSRQNEYGYHLLFRAGREPLTMLGYARIVPILIALGGGLLAWFWGRELSGRPLGGVLSAFVLLTYPEYAGHGRFLTFDVPTLVACGAISWFALLWWRRPNWKRAATLALAVAIGSQVKLPVTVFSAFVLLTVVVLTAGRGLRAPSGRTRLRRLALLSLLFAGAFVAASWAG